MVVTTNCDLQRRFWAVNLLKATWLGKDHSRGEVTMKMWPFPLFCPHLPLLFLNSHPPVQSPDGAILRGKKKSKNHKMQDKEGTFSPFYFRKNETLIPLGLWRHLEGNVYKWSPPTSWTHSFTCFEYPSFAMMSIIHNFDDLKITDDQKHSSEANWV